MLFVIASSTATATSTLFSVDNTGLASSTSLIVSSAGSSGTTCAQFSAAGLLSSTGSACGAGGGSDAFLHAATFGTTSSATTTSIWLQSSANLFSSSTVQFGTAGSSQFFFNSNVGNLGLGTTSPFASLQIATTTGKNLVLTDSSAGANLKHWLFSSQGGNFYLGTTTDVFATSTPAAMTILSNGDFGIGTTTPFADFSVMNESGSGPSFVIGSNSNATQLIVDQSGNLGLGTSTPWGLLSVNPNGLANGAPQFVVGSSTQTSFIVANNSNIGIGTSSPYGLLSIFAGTTTAGNFNSTLFVISSSTSSGTGATSTLFTVKSTGNVGVGTTTPWGLFSINANGLLNGAPQFVVGSSSATNFIIDSIGRVGIGTSTFATSSDALSVIGSISSLPTASTPPRILSQTVRTTLSNNATAISVVGRYAYYSDLNSLAIYDVVNPVSPVFVGVLNASSSQSVVSGSYAYLVNSGTNLFQIADISNPSIPQIVGTLSTGASTGPNAVYVSGHYAYVTLTTSNALQIIDISVPTAPVFMGSITVGSGPNSVFVQGKYAYVVSGASETLATIDVSNPSAPQAIGSVLVGGGGTSPQGLYVSGRYAYVPANATSQLFIYSLSAANPVQVGVWSTGASGPTNVYVSGRYAYLVDIAVTPSLYVIDVSNPATPFTINSTRLMSNGKAITVAGRYAYAASGAAAGSNGFQILDLNGFETNAAMIHSLEAGNLQVRNDLFAWGNINIQGGISAGRGGFFSNGMGAFVNESTSSLTNVPALSVTTRDNNVSGISDVFSITHAATGTIASGMGTGLLFQNSTFCSIANCLNATSTATSTARIASIITNVSTSSPASDLAFYTKNLTGTLSERMRLTSPGNLGVGTTSAFALLQSATTTGKNLVLSDSGAGTNLKHWLFSSMGGNLYVGTTTDVFATSTPPAFTISNNGSVGLSSSTPSSLFSLTAPSATGEIFDASTNAGVSALHITSGGKVGVGTTSPSQALSVSGNTYITGAVGIGGVNTGTGLLVASLGNCVGSNALQSNAGLITCGTVVTGGQAAGGGWTATTTGNVGFVVMATSTFNVGIGATTSPYAKLSIVGTGGVNASTTFAIIPAAGQTANIFDIYNTSGVQTSVMNSSGFFGLGSTTPWGQFSINANGLLSGAPQFVIGSSTQTSFIVANNNSVGVGTTTPWAKLSVEMGASSSTSAFVVSNFASSSPAFYVGGVTQYGYIGAGTSTPWGMFSINPNGLLGGTPSFVVGSSSATYFMINNGGKVGVGTSSPWGFFSIQASTSNPGNFPLFVVGSSTATTSLIVAANGFVGVGTSSPNAKFTIGMTPKDGAYSMWVGNFGSTSPAFAIGGPNTTSAGNVMIGTTTATTTTLAIESNQPTGSNVLMLAGSSGTGKCYYRVGGTTIVCSSDARLKHNVTDVGPTLSKLMQLRPVNFNWNAEIGTSTQTHLGFIAQEVLPLFPQVVNIDEYGMLAIGYADMVPILTGSIQDVNRRFEAIATTSTSTIGMAVTAGTTTDATSTDAVIWGHNFFSNLFARIVEWFANATNGIGKFFAGEVHTKTICVGEAGSETCLTKAELDALIANAAKGAAGASTPAGGSSGGSGGGTPPAPGPIPATSTPQIQVNGKNPATINVGDTYADLGATITGPSEDLNLGITASVDGGASTSLDAIHIDTASAGDHTIIYSVTDPAGNTGSASRSVSVVLPTPLITPPPTDPATTTPPITPPADSGTGTTTTP